MTVDLPKVKRCPACGSEHIIYKKAEDEIICQDCGEIFTELPPELEKKYKKASDVI
ncbi:hypothetical protein HYS48_01190 [Candidatus Woesearchaeota archaeon]|nr:hypothetical protein [Candidatus Woesearchaeota archaeon]